MPVFSRANCAAMLLYALPSSTGSVWNGTWKLNKAMVHMVPPPLAVGKAGPQYTMTLGQTYRFQCEASTTRGKAPAVSGARG